MIKKIANNFCVAPMELGGDMTDPRAYSLSRLTCTKPRQLLLKYPV